MRSHSRPRARCGDALRLNPSRAPLRSPTRIVHACLLALALLTASTAVDAIGVACAQGDSAGADERARLAFERGRALYDSGRFDDAEHEFQTAYRISGRVELLYNLYLTRRDGGHLTTAADALREFVERRELGPDAPETRRLRVLEQQIASGATSAGDTSSSGGGSPDEALLYAGIGVAAFGGVLLLTSVITGALALGDLSTLTTECPGHVCGVDQRGLFDRAGALVLTTDVLWISGAVIAAVGVVLLAVGLTSSSGESQSARHPSRRTF